jgi:hypothetical protein
MYDTILFSKSNELHFEHLEIVLNILRTAGFALNSTKYKILREEIKIL